MENSKTMASLEGYKQDLAEDAMLIVHNLFDKAGAKSYIEFVELAIVYAVGHPDLNGDEGQINHFLADQVQHSIDLCNTLRELAETHREYRDVKREIEAAKAA